MATTVGDRPPRRERSAVTGGERSVAEVLAENDVLRRELGDALARARRLEEELVAARRRGGIGRFAGGVAHDFSNVMAVIAGYAELMLRRLDPADPLHARAEAIQQATTWGLNLTERVLAWGRAQAEASEPTDLNAVVSAVVGTLQPLLGAAVEVDTRLDPAVVPASMSPGQLEQIVLNLVLNARDAMDGEGRLTVETANAEYGDPVSRARRVGVMLRIADTGCGMDAATLARVFEPFFTTKPPGKGTGLGLSTVLDIVTQHGGRVEAASDPGKGSTFVVYLPRAEPAAAPGAGTAAAGGRTVLLVDDEPGVRELIREILEIHDYAVLEARDSEEALAVSSGHAGPIALVIADLNLPGVRGEDVVERLRARRPGLKVIYMSGDLENPAQRRLLLRHGHGLLHKPFSVDALVRAVHEVLGAPSPG